MTGEYTEDVTRSRIFEVLRNIRARSKSLNESKGAFLIFGRLPEIFDLGFVSLGKEEEEKNELELHGNIHDATIVEKLRNYCGEGAILVDEEGNIYFPSVYVNVNLRKVNKDKIKPEYCARHIAALYVSTATSSTTFSLSESRGIITEFRAGDISRESMEDDEEEKEKEVIKEKVSRELIKKYSEDIPQNAS